MQGRAMKLVLLPGLDGTGVLFQPFLAALAPLALEPVVIGYPPRQALGYEQLLRQVRAALPQDGPYILLGESFGGPLALRLAAEHPPRLQALILSGSFISCPFAAVPSWAAYCVRPLPFRAFPLFARLTGWLQAASDEHRLLSQQALSQVADFVFAHRLREIIRVDVAAELRACAVPILYLQGKYDWAVPAANLARILRIKPDVHTASIASSHMILKTKPHQAVQAIDRFLRRVGLI
jgi:pimeloyl-[acyl-carrier protein] methyl ester esterase